MMKLNRRAGLLAGVVAAVTMLVAPAAFASNTLSVDGPTSPPADVSIVGTNTGTLSFASDSIPPMPASCVVGSVAGYVKRGASVTAGQKLGAVTQLAFGTTGTPCIATSLTYPVRFDNNPVGTEWPIIVTATTVKGWQAVPIRIDNVDMKMRSISKSGTPGKYACDMRIRGTLTGTFDQQGQNIVINPPAGNYSLNNIDAYDGTGTDTTTSGVTCAGQIWSGDSMRMAGEFHLVTPMPGGGGIHW